MKMFKLQSKFGVIWFITAETPEIARDTAAQAQPGRHWEDAKVEEVSNDLND